MKSDQNASISVCQIYAWCPVELDVLPMPGHGFKYVINYSSLPYLEKWNYISGFLDASKKELLLLRCTAPSIDTSLLFKSITNA